MRYQVTGISKIKTWHDEVGYVEMDCFYVDSIKDIPSNLNDGGFGAKEILGGWVRVWDRETGNTRYYKVSRSGRIYPKNNPYKWPKFLFRYSMF